MTTRDAVFCPECEEFVPHDRGYLVEHYVTKQRGELVTGKRMCDGSNTKPELNLKTVRFTGLCTNCVTTVKEEFRETFPGSLGQYGGIMTVQCPECGPEGDYCSLCDHRLQLDNAAGASFDERESDISAEIVDLMGQVQNQGADPVATMERVVKLQLELDQIQQALPNPGGPAWVNDLGEATCPDGQLHQQVHRPQGDRPVLLTDNHVIKGDETKSDETNEDMNDLGFRCSPDGPQLA